MIDIKIKRVDKAFPMPEYQTSGAAGFDFYTRVDAVVKPREIKLLPTNLIMEIPEGFMLLMASRSSTPKKTGLMLPHSVGIFDNDFCGEDDEMMIQVYNILDEEVILKAGDRIAQGILVPVEKANWNEVETMAEKSRGGFGTTGTRIAVKEFENE